jgi:3-oxoacyl-[acyl-carrier protein] reductase
VIHPHRFDGRVAVVTGGAGAFGTAIAGQLCAEGASVVIADVDLDAANRLASTLGDGTASFRLDVTEPASVADAMAFAEHHFGALDVLVNNAGLTHRITPLDELPDPEFDLVFDLVFDVNVKGTFLCSKHAIPALRRGDGGAIVNISSVAAIAHRPGNTVYSASKAAVMAFTRNLALELAPTIRVNAVLPVAADTPFMVAAFGERLPAEAAEAMRAGVPLGRLCEPADVADAVTYLASGDAAFVTGACLPVDGGRHLG